MPSLCSKALPGGSALTSSLCHAGHPEDPLLTVGLEGTGIWKMNLELPPRMGEECVCGGVSLLTGQREGWRVTFQDQEDDAGFGGGGGSGGGGALRIPETWVPFTQSDPSWEDDVWHS